MLLTFAPGYRQAFFVSASTMYFFVIDVCAPRQWPYTTTNSGMGYFSEQICDLRFYTPEHEISGKKNGGTFTAFPPARSHLHEFALWS